MIASEGKISSTLSLQQKYQHFINALANRDVDLCSKYAAYLHLHHPRVYEVLYVLYDLYEAKQQIKKVNSELQDAHIKISFLQVENQNLKELENSAPTKKESIQQTQTVKYLNLLFQQQFEQVLNNTNDYKDQKIRKLTKNLWEYDLLKKYSDSNQEWKGIKQPFILSKEYTRIKELILLSNDKIEEIHNDYNQALNSMLNYNSKSTKLQTIPTKNIKIIQIASVGLKNAIKFIDSQQDDEKIQEQKNALNDSDFEHLWLKVESKQKPKMQKYFSNTVGLQNTKANQFPNGQNWERLNQILSLLETIEGKQKMKINKSQNNYFISVDYVLNNVLIFMNSYSNKQMSSLVDDFEGNSQIERKAIIEFLHDRISYMEKRQQQFKSKIVHINNILSSFQPVEFQLANTEQLSQIDGMIDTIISNINKMINHFKLLQLKLENNSMSKLPILDPQYFKKIESLEQTNKVLRRKNSTYYEQLQAVLNLLQQRDNTIKLLQNQKQKQIVEFRQQLQAAKLQVCQQILENQEKSFQYQQTQNKAMSKKIDMQKQRISWLQQSLIKTKDQKQEVVKIKTQMEMSLKKNELELRKLQQQKKEQRRTILSLQEQLINISDQKTAMMEQIHQLQLQQMDNPEINHKKLLEQNRQLTLRMKLLEQKLTNSSKIFQKIRTEAYRCSL